MARLIRMDHTGHTTLAEWTRRRRRRRGGGGSFRASSTGLLRHGQRGRGPGRAGARAAADADLVILRRPIAGG